MSHRRPSSTLTCLSVAVCCAGLLTTPAWSAATVYRCGQTYQDRPCEGAQALTLNDSRDANQRAQAKDVAATEKRMAKTLADERRARDKAAQSQTHAAGIPLPGSAIAEAKADVPPDCGKDGKPRAKSRSGKTANTVCGDAKVRYAVPPDNNGNNAAR